MHSTLTEPIGPRSPDEILDVVYRRTHHVRRRRRQQLSAAVAVVALGLAGVLSLRPGDDSASRLRVVDESEVERAADDQAAAPAPTADESSDRPERATTTTAAATPATRAPAGGDLSNDVDVEELPPPPTTTTTTTLPPGPGVELLAQANDAPDDSTPPFWYYDIVQGSMHLDLRNDIVVFSTQYRSPSGPDTPRETRTLRSYFEFSADYVSVDVTETNDTLGRITINGRDCDGCTAEFDEVEARLSVVVPVAEMNENLEEDYGSGSSIEQADIDTLHLLTAAPGAESTPADTTEESQ